MLYLPSFVTFAFDDSAALQNEHEGWWVRGAPQFCKFLFDEPIQTTNPTTVKFNAKLLQIENPTAEECCRAVAICFYNSEIRLNYGIVGCAMVAEAISCKAPHARVVLSAVRRLPVFHAAIMGSS